MAKNITIAEGSQAKNFSNVAKIRTNVIGGGTQNWVPEDEAGMYANLGVAEITKNGTYKASDENLDGFSQVAVSVQPKTKTKTITKNGTYKASKDKVDGYSEISVQVPTEGGGGDPTLVTKEITENGTYNASDDSADGYSSVTVNVSGGSIGGETVTATALEDLQAGDKVYIKGGYSDSMTLLGNISEGGTSGFVIYDGSEYLYFVKNNDIYRKTIANIGVPNTAELSFHDNTYNHHFDGNETCVGGKLARYPITGGSAVFSAITNNILAIGGAGKVGGEEFNGLLASAAGMVTERNELLNAIQYYYSNRQGGTFGYQDINGVSFGDRYWADKVTKLMVGTPASFEGYDLSASFPSADFDAKFRACHPVGNYMIILWDGRVYAVQIGTTNVQDLGVTYTASSYDDITHNYNSSRLIITTDTETIIIDSGLNVKKFNTVLRKSYIVGDYIVRGSNHDIYSFVSGRTMSKTGDKSTDSMGICQGNVSKNNTGTAVILFS